MKPAERLLAIAGAVGLVALIHAHIDMLGDGFWYVATGRFLLETRSLPLDEPFSYAGVRGPWFANVPLSEVLFAWIDGRLGLRALMLFCALVYGAGLTLVWLEFARTTRARLVTFPLAAFAVFLERADLSVRGQTLANLALAVLFVCLFRLRDGRRVPLYVPVLLGAIWINVHPSVVLGLLIPLGMAAALRLGEPAGRPAIAPFVQFAGLVGVGSLANPYGPRLLGEIARFMGAESTTTIDLFRSPDFRSWDVLVALAIAMGLIAWSLRRASADTGPRVGTAEAALTLAMVLATCMSRRYVTVLCAFEVVVLGRLLAGVAWSERPVPPALAVAPAALCLALSGYALSRPRDPFQHMPVAAAAFVDQHGLADNVLNPLHWGGYLDYRWGPHRRVFIDGRTTQFENGVLSDHALLQAVGPGAREALDVYLVNTIVWERGSPLDQALAGDPAWQRVFEQGFSVVYTRKKPLPLRPHAPDFHRKMGRQEDRGMGYRASWDEPFPSSPLPVKLETTLRAGRRRQLTSRRRGSRRRRGCGRWPWPRRAPRPRSLSRARCRACAARR